MESITIYTDGACSGNPGPGGWAAIILGKPLEERIFGGEKKTTNNRMEMTAVIKALESIKTPSCITLYSDSQYVLKGITEWISGWKKKGWKTSNKKPVLNQDLWIILDSLNVFHNVEWKWVKGHSGYVYNEEVDSLARKGMRTQ
jgi:ribonuclease HI